MLSNSKQEALSVALDGGRRGGGGGESSVEDLTRAITDDIRRMPGNNNCCDCGAPGNLCQSINKLISISPHLHPAFTKRAVDNNNTVLIRDELWRTCEGHIFLFSDIF